MRLRDIEDITLVNTTYKNKQVLEEVDLAFVPWENNSMLNAFYNCQNLTTVTNINENVTNMVGSFAFCSNLVNAPAIPSNVIDMANATYHWQYGEEYDYGTFYNCSNLVNAPDMSNATNVTNMSMTFYGCTELVNAPDLSNCINVMDMSNTFGNCQKLDDITLTIPNNVINMSYTFLKCVNIVNAPVIPDSVTNMSGTFWNCFNLVNVLEISNSVIDISDTFHSCVNLVNAPAIPDSVTNMSATFWNCYNLVNVPEISNSAINMGSTFHNCFNLVNAPDLSNCMNLISLHQTFEGCNNLSSIISIPNSVNDMVCTFYGCNNLSVIPNIPSNVTNMYRTFVNCKTLFGIINIESTNIISAYQCFYNTSLEKNVYIYFKDNGVNTYTYNSFINAGYSTTNRVNGVLLMDLNPGPDQGYWRYDTLENSTKLLYEWVGNETTIWAIKNNSLFNDYGYDAALEINTSQSNTPFYNNPRVEVAELEFVPWVNDSMAYAFYNAVNIVAIHNIHYNVTNYHKAFWNCSNLSDVTIPASIFDNGSNADISDAFVGTNITNVTYVKNDGTPYVPDPTNTSTPPYNASGSYSNTPIVTTPDLPGSTDDLSWAFEDCYYLENTSMLPQGAVNMQGTFYNCYNLKEYKNISSDKIEDVSMCFYNCNNLIEPGIIHDNATNMYRTYYNCVNMQFIPNIPNCVINMQETYYNCQIVTNIPNVPGNVVNMEGTFDGCVNVSGDINITSEIVTNAYNCFNNTTTQKNVYIPYYYENGELSATYNAFLEAGYISETPINGVYIYDMYYDPELEGWRYQPIANREKILLEYTGLENNISVPTNKTYINCYNSEDQINAPFYNKSLFESVDLRNVKIINNDMTNAFYNCQNLTNVTNINENVTNMTNAFRNCIKLNSVPTIPNNVVNMFSTFSNCHSLQDAPIIPDSVVDMLGTFAYCSNLRNVSKFSNNVEQLGALFIYCNNLVNIPAIPDSVNNMQSTFQGCTNLNGTILIRSDKIENAEYCFYGTTLEKNVYIPFTYQNGEYTETYNSFINANYSSSIRNDGVLLYDYTTELYEWLFTSLPNGYTSLYKYVGNNSDVIVPNNNIVINMTQQPFYGKNINSVDMGNISCENNSMYRGFYDCYKLSSVTNINQNITNMANTFYNCQNLVTAPNIPDSVTNMYGTFSHCLLLENAPVIPLNANSIDSTFYNCQNLVTAPNIPDNILNMNHTFANCYKLNNISYISNNIESMEFAFSNCYNLVNIPDLSNCNNLYSLCGTFYNCFNLETIPNLNGCNNIENMDYTFYNCQKLTGDIYIESNCIGTVSGCFGNTSLDKNVYIPFYYSNGDVSATYRAFTLAGYSETERKDGVLLKKLKNYNVNFDGYIITNNGADVELQKYEGSESIIVTPHLYY